MGNPKNESQLSTIELLKALREDIKFQAVMMEMVKFRPTIPEWSLEMTVDDTQKSMERWKNESGKRAGFDMLYALITGVKL